MLPEDDLRAAAVLSFAREAPAAAGQRGTLPLPATGPSRGCGPRAAKAGRTGYFGRLRYVGQHARTYLLCEAPGGALVVIDQHASHERLLFQRLREAFRRRRAAQSSRSSCRRWWTLAPASARALEAGLGDLAGSAWRSSPSAATPSPSRARRRCSRGWTCAALLADVAGQLAEVERGSAVEEAFHGLLATMACHAAVRANQELGAEEARALLTGWTGSTSRPAARTAARWSSSSRSPSSSGGSSAGDPGRADPVASGRRVRHNFQLLVAWPAVTPGNPDCGIGHVRCSDQLACRARSQARRSSSTP